MKFSYGDLDLKDRNPFFAYDTLAYKDVSPHWVWLQTALFLQISIHVLSFLFGLLLRHNTDYSTLALHSITLPLTTEMATATYASNMAA